jgi:hypothetical protein
MHTNIETFDIEEQEGDNNALTSDGHTISNTSENGQVCIYQEIIE